MQGDEIPPFLYCGHILVYLSRTLPIYRSVLSSAAVPSDRGFSHMLVLISAVSRPATLALEAEIHLNLLNIMKTGGPKNLGEKPRKPTIWRSSGSEKWYIYVT